MRDSTETDALRAESKLIALDNQTDDAADDL